MFTQLRFNLKFLGAILFALVFLVGGFFVSNIIIAETSSIISGVTLSGGDSGIQVSGDLSSGFVVKTNGDNNLHDLILGTGTTSNPKLTTTNQTVYIPFGLSSTTATGLNTYLESKGLPSENVTHLISGIDAAFYLKVVDSSNIETITLVDGFMHDLNGSDPTLRIDGNYPTGTYTYTSALVNNSIIMKVERIPVPTLTSTTITANDVFIGNLLGAILLTNDTGSCDGTNPGSNACHTLNVSTVITADGNLSAENAAFTMQATKEQKTALTTYFAGLTGTMATQIASEIAGTAPFFYFVSNGSGVYSLADGFKWGLGLTNQPLVIDDNYPSGAYSFVGTIAGVSKTVTFTVTKPDTTPPTATVIQSGNSTGGTITYTFNEDMKITNKDGSVIIGTIAEKLAVYQVTGSDYGTITKVNGITITDASLVGNVLTITYTGTLVDQTDVKYVVDAWGYKISDLAGNKMLPAESVMFTVTGVDTIKPTATVAYSTTTPTNGNVTATITPSEAIVGGTTHTFTENGSYTFTFTDLAGNSGSVIASVSNIDKVAPTGTIVINSGAAYTNSQNVTLTLSASDALSGVIQMEVYKNTASQGIEPYSTTRLLTLTSGDATKTVKVKFFDAAGNGSSLITTTIILDTNAPTATVDYSTMAPTKSNVMATITPSEEVVITNEGGLTTHEFSSNGSFPFTFTDRAGNTGSATATVNNIDNIAPVIASHANVTVEATSSSTIVNYDSPATSDANGDSTAECTPASGSGFNIGTTPITCTKTDVVGNSATATTFNVIVEHKNGPVVALKGDSVLTLEIHTPYLEQGINTIDAVDEAPTITYSGIVDPNVVGSYTVTYDSYDSAGNHSLPLKRTVNVVDSIDTAFNVISSNLATAGISNNLNDITTDKIKTFTGLSFEKSVNGVKMGKITFTKALDLSKIENRTFLENLGSKLDMSSGYISLDARTATDLKNAGAKIEIYTLPQGLDMSKISLTVKDESGKILGDVASDLKYESVGMCEVGGICTIFSFGADHFTSFEAKVVEDRQITPETNQDGSGTAKVDNTTPEVVLTNPTQAVIIETGDTTNPTIDVNAFVDPATVSGVNVVKGTLPAINIDGVVADVSIPATTVVTGPANWDGIIDAPTAGTPIGGNAPAGFSVGDTVITVGSAEGTLTFDNAVTLILPGVTGTVGYRPSGSNVWTQITNVCAGTYLNPTDPSAGGECAINNGTDTKIVTFHFTSFGSLNTNRSSSGSYIKPVVTPAVPAKVEIGDGCAAGNKFSTTTGRNCNAATPAVVGKVLGAEKFNFTKFMKHGSKGNEIIELQKLLTSLGYECGTADGKFGPKTKAAVIKFQISNKLVGDGVIGAKTRTLLNK